MTVKIKCNRRLYFDTAFCFVKRKTNVRMNKDEKIRIVSRSLRQTFSYLCHMTVIVAHSFVSFHSSYMDTLQ